MSDKLKYFIMGCIATMAVSVSIYYGIKLFSNENSNPKGENGTTEKTKTSKESNFETINGVTYKLVSDNDLSFDCDSYTNAWFVKRKWFVTNDGILYGRDGRKYSSNNQNCIVLNDKIKFKAIVWNHDNIYLISTNNETYRFNGEEYQEIKKTDRLNYDYFNTNVKYAFEKTGPGAVSKREYYVLKTDGKIYLTTFWWETIKNKYIKEKEEVYKSYENEIIKQFQLVEDANDGYIITNKSVYIPIQVNKEECEKYADIKCKFEYRRDDYLSRYADKIISFEFFDGAYGYDFTTSDGREIKITRSSLN